MFTGLIEAVGEVVAVEHDDRGTRLAVSALIVGELRPGDSIAVNGVCLTAVTVAGSEATMDLSPETLHVTALKGLDVGARVNLERPLLATARLGGHFVQGHVDGTGRLERVTEEGDCYRVTISYPRALAAGIVPKGSIAVDGISLTVAALREEAFDVQIVPFTWLHTNLPTLSPGAGVNLETDILGKYVARFLQGHGQP